MYTKEDYIAVFDSGVGGISVLRQLRKLMPQEKYVYFGDSANAPYGTRPTQQVRELTLAAAEKLMSEYPVKALVVACNTATAAGIDNLREKYPDLIVIGIEPALVHRFDATCQVEKIPAPGLVELIESGRGDSEEAMDFLHNLLDDFVGKLDALVLGCTHYPFVKRNIAAILGPQVEILHGGRGTARETRRRLEKAGLLGEDQGSVEIINSAQNQKLMDLCWKLLEQA